MKIILHAGTHKTGTTSFQTALRRNAGRLRATGTAVMVTPRQANAGDPGRFDPGWLRLQADAARADGMARLVLSHEVISTLSADALSALLSALGGTEFRYVVAFRHWTSFLPSRWRQNCKRRDAQSFQRFLARLDACPPEAHPFDFAAIPETARAAGITDLRLLSWEDDGEAAQGLLGPLWRACGLAGAGLPEAPGWLARLLAGRGGDNRAGARGAADRVRLFNHLRARHERLAPDALFDRLCGAGPEPDFFDQADLVARALARDARLRRDLDAVLEPCTGEVVLTPDRFARLAARLDAASQAVTGRARFFSAPRPVRLRAAGLEADALPADLARRMWTALRAAAPAQARHEARRARLLRLRERVLRH